MDKKKEVEKMVKRMVKEANKYKIQLPKKKRKAN